MKWPKKTRDRTIVVDQYADYHWILGDRASWVGLAVAGLFFLSSLLEFITS